MKIKIIAPARKPEWGESFWDLKTLCKLTGRKVGGAPLALPTLAALTPSDVEVVLTDENVESINFDEKVDLVGITGMTCVIPRSYEIADEFRKRGVPVVMGGIHVSMLSEEAIQHCDSVVIGEAEEIWEQVLRDAQKNDLQKFYKAPQFPDLSKSPIPRWDLLKYRNYPIFPVQIGRGCPYDCEFCSVQTFNGRHYRRKNLDIVLHEIDVLRKLERKKPVFFVDDNILSDVGYAKALFHSLIPLGIRWWCQASVSGMNDDDTLGLMYKAGCREIFTGFESVYQKSLDSMHKSPVNKTANYSEIIKKIHEHKMAVFGSFILGSDDDDEQVFEATAKFIDETDMGFAMINILTPPPGTALYKRLEKEGRLTSNAWEEFNAEYVCFEPKLMSQKKLQEKRINLLRTIFSYKNLYKRLHNLWGKNVHVRQGRGKGIFTMSRIYVALKELPRNPFDFNKTIFIVRSLFKPKPISLFSIIMALNFHDYAKKLSKNKI